MQGGDAAGRLGINMGEPAGSKIAAMVKTSAAFHGASYVSLTQQRQEMVKEAFWGAGIRAGMTGAARAAAKYVPRIFGQAAQRGGQAASGIARGGVQAAQRAGGGVWNRLSGYANRAKNFFGRQVAPKGSTASNVGREAPGLVSDFAIEGYDASRNIQGKDPLFTQVTGIGKPTSAIQGR